MSAWGNKDDVSSAGTVTLAGLAVTGSGTAFAVEQKVGDVITIADAGGDATIATITSATALTLVSNTELTSGTLSGKNYTVSEKPNTVIETDTNTTGAQVFGVSSAEQLVDITTQQTIAENNRQIANTAAHAGWVKLGDIYTDASGNVRRKNETLVAMSSISGDAADDTTLPDS